VRFMKRLRKSDVSGNRDKGCFTRRHELDRIESVSAGHLNAGAWPRWDFTADNFIRKTAAVKTRYFPPFHLLETSSCNCRRMESGSIHTRYGFTSLGSALSGNNG